jgi:hypothetical protein
MKTQKLLSTLLVVAFAVAPQLLNTSRGALAASGGYSANPNFADCWPGSPSRPACHDSVEGYASLRSVFHRM